jgi:hypothetical protein
MGDNIEFKMLQKFILMENIKNKENESLFHDINIKDPLSTNYKLELFYKYMNEYQDLFKKNKCYVDIYEPKEIENNQDTKLYALLIGDNSKVSLVSKSYISLLKYGCLEFNDNIKWNIISL